MIASWQKAFYLVVPIDLLGCGLKKANADAELKRETLALSPA